jgi:heme oxygenase-like protein
VVTLRAYGDAAPADLHGRGPLPDARGPMSEWVLSTLRRSPHACSRPPRAEDDPLSGDDSALALYLLYELHYRGLVGVDDAWEWEPSLLAGRRRLEDAFIERLRAEVPLPEAPDDIAAALRERTRPDDGPTLSAYCEHEATWEELLEVCVHRSAWQLKEADPHTWALPRLGGRPKAALAEIQAGEYGDGAERDVHQNLYMLTLQLIGLDPRYGYYLDHLPGVTLATVNLVTLFGLHRRWLPAMVGHFAAFEMSSVTPMSAYSAALRRFGAPTDATHFFDAHVVADAGHALIAADELAAGLVEQDPAAGRLILFGADALTWTESLFSDHIFRAWKDGQSSLLRPLEPCASPHELRIA